LSSVGWTAEQPYLAAPSATGWEAVVRVTFAPAVALGCITFMEPSPADLMCVLTMGLWFIGGFSIHVALLPIIGLFLVYLFAGFIALTPYWAEEEPPIFQLQSAYLVVLFIFFAIYLSEKTHGRMRLCLSAFAYGAVAGCAYGLAGYLDLFGLMKYTLIWESRIAGAFKDPNVFGSYMVMAAVYLLQCVISGRSKHPYVSALCFGVVSAAIVLSFSRGAWGATTFSCALMYAATYITTKDRALRRRMVRMAVLALVLVSIALAIILSSAFTTELLSNRVGLQEYDNGVTGRFGNQVRSLPLLLDRPNGFGPLRFRLWFGLEPHSSYVNAFASYGWLGGFTWLCIVGSTCFIGFRLMFKASPYRTYAHVIWPALLAMLFQGFQIDIDHWRWVFLQFGAIWGLEAARVRWEMQERRALLARY
jgi:hypothetical protein